MPDAHAKPDSAPRSLADLTVIACALDVLAPKAGNVHIYLDDEADPEPAPAWQDFVISAMVAAPPLALAATVGVGEAVLAAVTATREAVGHNTNLGMLLLLAPMCAAAERAPAGDLAGGVRAVLDALTLDDAARVFEAIRLAEPGGLGAADEQDVRQPPTRPLLDAMTMASGRDLIARQYANGYAEIFGPIQQDLAAEPAAPLDLRIVGAHLKQMARDADTLIARKCGAAVAQQAQRMAADTLAAGWPDCDAGHDAFDALDAWLRADGNCRNPGATADVIAAGLFAALHSGALTMPAQWALPL